MSSNARKGSLVPPLLGIVFGAGVLAATSTIRPGMLPNDPGPSFMPTIAGIGLIAASLYLVFVREPHEGLPDRGGSFRLLATIVLVGAYLNLMEPIGFSAATALFLAFEMWVIGVRNPLNLTMTPIALSAAVYVTFRYGLDVPLPATRILGVPL